MRELNAELSLLGLTFGENLLAETNSSYIVIGNKDDLAGLPDGIVTTAAETAQSMNMAGKWVFTAQKPSWIPFLQYSTRRDLREQLYRAYFMRGDRDNGNDNKETLKKIITLRAERARLLGYPTYADFVLEERMAKNPATVMAFLQRLWSPALARAEQEAAEMQAIIDRERVASAWPPGTGGTMPKSCARKSTPSTTRPFAPISPWRTSRPGYSPSAPSCTGCSSPSWTTFPSTTPRSRSTR